MRVGYHYVHFVRIVLHKKYNRIFVRDKELVDSRDLSIEVSNGLQKQL